MSGLREWFVGCGSPEEAKKLYRELCFQWHPDTGNRDHDTMAAINDEYHEILNSFDGFQSRGSDGKEHTYHYNEPREQEIIDKIAELIGLKLTGINIWLVGTWIWIDGDTKPVKDELSEAGCMWHSKRRKWYWKPYGYKSFYNANVDFSGLAAAYGLKTIQEDEDKRGETDGNERRVLAQSR